MSRSKQVSFSASEELYEAIEIHAYSGNETIAAAIRRIIAKEMVEYHLFDARAAVTEQTAATNSRYIPKSARPSLYPPNPERYA